MIQKERNTSTSIVFLIRSTLTVLFFFFTFVMFFAVGAYAVDPTPPPSPSPTPAVNQDKIAEKQKEIEELKNKISQLQGEAKTLSSAISYLTNKKTLTQKQVEATELEIVLLSRDIESLEGKIATQEKNLDTYIAALLKEAQTEYKQPDIGSFELLFSSHSFSDLYTRYKYMQLTQAHYQSLLAKTTQTKIDYDNQKISKEKKQKSVETLKAKLETQKRDLESQEAAKKKLLTDTKNSESTYQKLLAQAEAELSSFASFAKSRGANVLPPQNSPDGWFFSQRDERWAGVCIGNSCGTKNEGRILEVGCLVSSTAMVKKKFGEDVNPITIARNTSYFFSNTAYMLQPWPAPGGWRYERSSYSESKLDEELKKNPVIAHMRIGTRDGHFIVIKSGEKGNYTIHDPIEGYDKQFSSFYRTSQISNINYLRKV